MSAHLNIFRNCTSLSAYLGPSSIWRGWRTAKSS